MPPLRPGALAGRRGPEGPAIEGVEGLGLPGLWQALTAPRVAWLLLIGGQAVVLGLTRFATTSYWHLATPEMLAGLEGAEPFQHRLLVPALVVLLSRLSGLGQGLLFVLAEMAAWAAAILVAGWALECFGVGGGRLGRRLLALTVTLPLVYHLILPHVRLLFPEFDPVGLEIGRLQWEVQSLYYFPYDLPAAVLAFLLILLIFRMREEPHRPRTLGLYLGLFVLATLNRETTLFLVPLFAVGLRGRLAPSAWRRALLIQLVAFAAIQLGLQAWLADHGNPHSNLGGTHYEIHLLKNLALLVGDPLYLLAVAARMGGGMLLLLAPVAGGLHPFLRQALLVFGVPFALSTLTFGRIQEYRVFAELAPLLWLAALQAYWSRLGQGDPRPSA